MKEQKHIDRIFQEKFKDFEVTPDDVVWEGLEAELHEKENKRRVIPIWLRFAGVAAGLLLLFTIGKMSFGDINGNKNTPQTVANDSLIKDSIKLEQNNNDIIKPNNIDAIVDEDVNGNLIEEKKSYKENVVNSSSNNYINNKSVTTPLNKQTEIISAKRNYKSNANVITNNTSSITSNYQDTPFINKNPKNISNSIENGVAQNSENKKDSNIKDHLHLKDEQLLNNTTNKDNAVATNNSTNKNKEIQSTIEEGKEKDLIQSSIEEAMASKEKIKDEEKIKRDRWSVTPNIAPVYFNTLGEGSSIHSQFNNNSKRGNLDIAYGIKAGYAVTEKLKIRSGVSKINVGYSTNNVFVFQSVGQNSGNEFALRNIDFKESPVETSIISAETLAFSAAPEVLAPNLKSSLNQEISFIEVPLEVAYTISDKKLNIDVIGGMSTMFLEDNNIYTDLNGEETLLGKANNINDVSYSANFGVGLDYEISKTLSLNFEPTFKYQISTFTNTSGDFQPYIIAVSSGLKFKF